MRGVQSQAVKSAPRPASSGAPARAGERPREEFSASTRWMHWLRALFITYLLLSGFEIANPYLQSNLGIPTRDNFLVGLVRGAHEMVGFALIAVTLVRIYTFILAREWRDGRVVLSGRSWASQIKYYLLLQGEERNEAGRYGPLQFVTYLVFYVLLVLIALTGWLLYGANYHR
ncbi:MAG: Ni/Fe-hydrogenase, b-type cytochrome subunit, partial [Bacillota bacterium]|nr:Ni/Fe-hydrogenase, b-type cytochrome subunit [Bacillota bacterium]